MTRRDERLADEVEHHLDLLTAEYQSRGLSPDEARLAARRAFGAVAPMQERYRDLRRVAWLTDAVRDVRYGMRMLVKDRWVTLTAVIVLALGTGANAAIFQLVNAVRLRPLPVASPAELVSIGVDLHGRPRVGRQEMGRPEFTEPLWQEIRAQQQAFSRVFAWGGARWDLSTQGEVTRADGFYVSGGFFDGLGVRAAAGRLLSDGDDRRGCDSPGAVLSHAFWHTRYGGARSVIGQRIALDRRSFEILGIAEPGFLGVEVGRAFDVALPLCAEPLIRGRDAATGRKDFWWLHIMGRLRPGWPMSRAAGHLAALSPAVFQATVPSTYTPGWARDYAAFTLTASDGSGGVALLPEVAVSVLWILFGATGVVLLLTCANVASLMLARATARGREIAVRLALGATRGRLMAQSLTESALLALAGTAGGVLVANWVSAALMAFLNSGSLPITLVVNLTPDWRVFTVTAVLAVLVSLLVGLAPAVKATRRQPAAIGHTDRSASDGHDALALRRALVVAQLALSIVLVVGATLCARTLDRLRAVDLGFDPAVLVAAVDLGRTSVPPAARLQAFDAIVDRLRTVPGVRFAAETVVVPLSGSDWTGQIVTGGEVRDGTAHFNAVGVDYFQVMRIPVVSGRTFARHDRPEAPRVAVVNTAFARRYLAGRDPIGQTFQVDGPRQRSYSIVGVVGDSKIRQVGDEAEPAAPGGRRGTFLPIAYLAAGQEMFPTPSTLSVVVRADASAAVATPALTRAITETVPGAAVSYEAINRYLDTVLMPQRLVAWLSGFFGVLALLIAAVGVYGTMSYLVTRRRVEFGVRMALGAGPGAIVRLVLGESGLLLAGGLGIGIVLAALLSRPLAGLLYGLAPFDPASFAIATLLLAGVGLFAAWVPASGAARVAPTVALRE